MSVVRDRYRIAEYLLSNHCSDVVCYCESKEVAKLLIKRFEAFRSLHPIPDVKSEFRIKRMYSYQELPYEEKYDFPDPE